MFLELHRKDNGKSIFVDARKIITFNEDDDGNGTVLMLVGQVIRVVQEPVATVAKALGKANIA